MANPARIRRRAELKQKKKQGITEDDVKSGNTQDQQETEYTTPSYLKSVDGKPPKAVLIGAGCVFVFLVLYLWSNLYMNKYIPISGQNKLLKESLNAPELVKDVFESGMKYENDYNDQVEESGEGKKMTRFSSFIEKYQTLKPTSTTTSSESTETPSKQEKRLKSDILPEDEDDNVKVVGDMKDDLTEAGMGGEIYTLDEIFEKLGVKRINDYQPKSDYERQLLKEFRMDGEPPENIAKKTDYYSSIIERGFKKDERFFVKKINDKKGYGLFANVDILPNEVLGIYTGIIQKAASDKGSKYEWYYSTIPDRKKEEMVELRVNAKDQGSPLRFVNHSQYYNTRLEYVPYNNQWYILFINNRFIRRGEEITVNYREKTKRMPEKIIDKWDKVEADEYKKLYEEYVKAYGQYQNQSQEFNEQDSATVNINSKEEL